VKLKVVSAFTEVKKLAVVSRCDAMPMYKFDWKTYELNVISVRLAELGIVGTGMSAVKATVAAGAAAVM
jgi:hypothetical protein